VNRCIAAELSFGNLVNAIFRCDKESRENDFYTKKLQKWENNGYEIHPNKEDQEDPETFIKKFLDPDETTKLDSP
jgi:hypothetical protein